MFGPLGLPELILIFNVALIVFGPRKLPEIGKTLGKALGEFKKASDELKNTIEREVHAEDDKERELPKMSFLDHLEELRKRLLVSIVALLAGFLVCWGYADKIYGYLQA